MKASECRAGDFLDAIHRQISASEQWRACRYTVTINTINTL